MLAADMRCDVQEETWDGLRLSCEAAVEHFGADECLPLGDVRPAACCC